MIIHNESNNDVMRNVSHHISTSIAPLIFFIAFGYKFSIPDRYKNDKNAQFVLLEMFLKFEGPWVPEHSLSAMHRFFFYWF